MPHQKKIMAPDIAFIICAPYFWFVYKNIYEHIKQRAVFIIDLGASFTKDDTLLRDSIVKILKENDAPFRILERQDYHFSSYLADFFKPYKVMISGWDWGCMDIPETANILKVNTSYGVGKELTLVRPSRCIHDLILAYGPRDSQLLALSTKTLAIGNPRFDDFYKQKFDDQLKEYLGTRLDVRKKTVLYLPTHGDLGSFYELIFALDSLVDYNVVIKPHYLLVSECMNFTKKNSLSHTIMLDDSADLVTLLDLADIAISDNSSAIFDVIQADKPILVADFWDDQFLNEKHKILKRYGPTTFLGATSYSQSIEQTIKRDNLVSTFTQNDDLRKSIEKALKNDGEYQVKRSKLRNELFSYQDDHCGMRAATAITQLLDGTIGKEKGILFHARINERNLSRGVYFKYDDMVYERNVYRSILQENHREEEFIIIIIDTGNSDDSGLKATLRSFVDENKEKCVIITDRVVDANIIEQYVGTVFLFSKMLSQEIADIAKTNTAMGCLFVQSGFLMNHVSLASYKHFLSQNQNITLSIGRVVDNLHPTHFIYKEITDRKQFKINDFGHDAHETIISRMRFVRKFFLSNHLYVKNAILQDALGGIEQKNFDEVVRIIKNTVVDYERVAVVGFPLYREKLFKVENFYIAQFASEQATLYFLDKRASGGRDVLIPSYNIFETFFPEKHIDANKHTFGFLERLNLIKERILYFFVFQLVLLYWNLSARNVLYQKNETQNI